MSKNIWGYSRVNSNEIYHADFKYIKKVPLPGGGFRYIYPEDEYKNGPTDFHSGVRNIAQEKRDALVAEKNRKATMLSEKKARQAEKDAKSKMKLLDGSKGGPTDFYVGSRNTAQEKKDALIAEKKRKATELRIKKQKELRDALKKMRNA